MELAYKAVIANESCDEGENPDKGEFGLYELVVGDHGVQTKNEVYTY